MPLPSLFKNHSYSNRSSLSLSPSSTTANPRPTISAPLPAGRVPPGFPQAGRVSSGGVTVPLVQIERGAAELNNNNDANPSPASSTSSYTPSTRKLLNRDRERQQGGPPSPQPESSTFGVSRRSSLLGRSKPPPNPPQYRQQQPDNDNLDPYLQQSPTKAPHSASRPQSMLPSPLEAETDTIYSIDSIDTGSAQHQNNYIHQNHHEGYQHPNPGTLEQYYDQGSQPYQQDRQNQPQQQGSQMMPAQPRRSADVSHQSGPPGPPSREVSALAGQQGYANQQGGRGVDQQSYQNHGAGSGGGQPPQAYDPAKFDGQPMGRVMTPEQARVDSRASQAPEAIDPQVLLRDHETLRTCILVSFPFPHWPAGSFIQIGEGRCLLMGC